MANKAKDLTGLKFNRFLVIKEAGRKNGKNYWTCLCDCGIQKDFLAANITTGKSKSCGCIVREVVSAIRLTHGLIKTPEYSAWRNAKNRCYNQKYKLFHCYGGRGIIMCDRWLGDSGFTNFLLDMGNKPSPKHTLDRYPNQNGNYEPTNCRWATYKEQQNNRRNNKLIEHNGEIISQAAWAERLGVTSERIRKELSKGVPFKNIYSRLTELLYAK